MPLQVLYMGNNLVKDWGEFMKLVSGGTGEVTACLSDAAECCVVRWSASCVQAELPNLEELLFVGRCR